MLIGAHESAAGGYPQAVARAREDGCESFQLFTAPPGRWSVSPDAPRAEEFRRAAAEEERFRAVLVHAPYLPNPASPEPELWVRSVHALLADYRRAAALGASGLVLHPGSHRGAGEGEGEKRVGEALSRLLSEVGEGPMLLLENTAGSGDTLGATFAQLARIRSRASDPRRVGFCLDTAHAFAAGYDLATPAAVRASLDRIDGEAGLALVRAFHLNDSEKPLGSRVDRHARIGEGALGLPPFRVLLADSRFQELPGVLETVPDPEGEGRYRGQLSLLRSLRGEG